MLAFAVLALPGRHAVHTSTVIQLLHFYTMNSRSSVLAAISSPHVAITYLNCYLCGAIGSVPMPSKTSLRIFLFFIQFNLLLKKKENIGDFRDWLSAVLIVHKNSNFAASENLRFTAVT